jgi:5-methylcytosine-specific restriction endonuclease McrA
MKNDRHARTEILCEICGTPKMVRVERVEQGMGKYCSRECSHEGRRRQERLKWGRKDLANTYKTGGKYIARWYDENGKTCSTTYGRWWWEMNVGEIPDGAVVMHKDNDPLNISPSNFILGDYKAMTDKGKKTLKSNPEKWARTLKKRSKKMKGRKASQETREKLSKARRGMKLSTSHKNNISKSVSKRWSDGGFDKIHKGENNWRWKGGIPKEYPLEFSKSLKDFIKFRDKHKCQVCSRKIDTKRKSHIHHIDGNKRNNNQDNLILLCVSCHTAIHSKRTEAPPIMAFRSKLQ